MVKKSSSWASWSKSSSDSDMNPDQMQRVHQQLANKARSSLDDADDYNYNYDDEDNGNGHDQKDAPAPAPANVEPGFESNYKRQSRQR
jgi:hypothetical protein